MQKATFGAGCFWHVEEAFHKVKGVVKTTAGFIGGTMKDPAYKDVCSDETGHAEAIQIEFDTKKVSYEDLLNKFWEIHDPTQLNRQGADIGTQYRSSIFYHNQKQKEAAIKSKAKLQKTSKYKNKTIVTDIKKALKFYPAEEYHQQYFQKHKLKKAFMCRM